MSEQPEITPQKKTNTFFARCSLIAFPVIILIIISIIYNFTDNEFVLPVPPEPYYPSFSLKVGEVIQLGGYDWNVLDVQGNKALILSDKVFENSSDIDKMLSYEGVREYLNGTFYNSSFTEEEKSHILETSSLNRENPWYNENGAQNETGTDKLFLLSVDEVIKCFGDSGQLGNKPADYNYIDDGYNKKRVAYDSNGEKGRWWLRTQGQYSGKNVFIDKLGKIDMNGNSYIFGIRPALWLNLEGWEYRKQPNNTQNYNDNANTNTNNNGNNNEQNNQPNQQNQPDIQAPTDIKKVKKHIVGTWEREGNLFAESDNNMLSTNIGLTAKFLDNGTIEMYSDAGLITTHDYFFEDDYLIIRVSLFGIAADTKYSVMMYSNNEMSIAQVTEPNSNLMYLPKIYKKK